MKISLSIFLLSSCYCGSQTVEVLSEQLSKMALEYTVFDPHTEEAITRLEQAALSIFKESGPNVYKLPQYIDKEDATRLDSNYVDKEDTTRLINGALSRIYPKIGEFDSDDNSLTIFFIGRDLNYYIKIVKAEFFTNSRFQLPVLLLAIQTNDFDCHLAIKDTILACLHQLISDEFYIENPILRVIEPELLSQDLIKSLRLKHERLAGLYEVSAKAKDLGDLDLTSSTQ